MIRLHCLNENCEYEFEVSEKELLENSKYYERCLMCNSKLQVAKESIKEIVKKDLYIQAEEYISKWQKEYGWDFVLDLIKNNDNQACARIYKDILRKRGFTIK